MRLALRFLPLGGNLRLRHGDQTPREIAHAFQRRLELPRWLGHEPNLRLGRPIVATLLDRRDDARRAPRSGRRSGEHLLVSYLCFECATIAETFESGSNWPGDFARSTCPAIDGRRTDAKKFSSPNLRHAKVFRGCLEHLWRHISSKKYSSRVPESNRAFPGHQPSVLPLDEPERHNTPNMKIVQW